MSCTRDGPSRNQDFSFCIYLYDFIWVKRAAAHFCLHVAPPVLVSRIHIVHEGFVYLFLALGLVVRNSVAVNQAGPDNGVRCGAQAQNPSSSVSSPT